MEGETIKSFLVGLGFGVDETSLAKFNKSIASASLRVTALYASIQIAAAGIFHAISGVSQGFEDMGYQLRIVAPAMNRWLVLRQAMLTAYAKAGVNLQKTVNQAILFNYSLAKTKFALEAVYKSVAAKFFPLLTKQMDLFRQKIFANMPKIQATLMAFVQFIFKAFQATVQLGTRIYSVLVHLLDFFVKLDKATNGWSTVILEVVAAWKLLNLSFLATPFGVIVAGIVALIALWDDFQVWKEGGKSLFNWAPVVPVINAVSDALGNLKDYVGDIFMLIFDLVGLFKDLFTLNFTAFKDDIKNTFADIGKYVQDLIKGWQSLINVGGSVLNLGSSIAGWAGQHLGLGGRNVGGITSPSPLIPGNSTNAQHVSQQTSIIVQGSADAQSTGKAVAGQQDRVNFDMTRNLKGALQ